MPRRGAASGHLRRFWCRVIELSAGQLTLSRRRTRSIIWACGSRARIRSLGEPAPRDGRVHRCNTASPVTPYACRDDGRKRAAALTIGPAILLDLSPSAEQRAYLAATCSVGRSLSRGVRWARAGRGNRSLELGTPSTDNRAQRCRGGVQFPAGEVPTSRCPRAKILPRAPRGCQQNLIYKVAERRPLPPDQSCGLARGEPSPCAFLVHSS